MLCIQIPARLAKPLASRSAARRTGSRSNRPRTLLVEQIEGRMLLSTVTLTSGGLLTYTAAIGAVNNLSISVAGGVYTLSDSGEIITLSGRANSRCLGDGTNTVTCPDSDVTALSVVLDDMNDLLSIQSTSDPATVSGGEGGDAVTARHNGLGAGLNVSDTGSTGTDSLSINSTAAGPETIGIASTQITRSLSNTIIYSGQETLIVTGTGSSDTINVTSTAAGSATLVDALDGGDSVTVTQSAVGPASLQVADSGTTGVDTLISNTASVGPEAIGISSTEVTRSSGGPVSYSGQESLTVNGSAASDTVTVTGTAPGTATTLNGQGGTADTIIVEQDAASIALSDTSLAVSGGPTLTLASIEAASLTGGPSSNTFTVIGWTGVATVDGGGGTDQLVAESTGDIMFAGNTLTVTGGGIYTIISVEQLDLSNGVDDSTIDISGFNGIAFINAGDGDDTVLGASSTDGSTLLGGGGNDNLFGGTSSDTIFGGCDPESTSPCAAGNDVIFGAGGNDVIFGATGNDVIFGGCGPESTSPCTSGNDVIFGAGGNDVIFGSGGNDVIFGGCDPDSSVSAGMCPSGVSGNDVIFGAGGNDVIFGATGNDVIFGGCDPESTSPCASGNDVIFGAGGNDVIFGAGGNDVIFGGCDPASPTTSGRCSSGVSGNDVISGGGGNDVIFGAGGNDVIFGGCDPNSTSSGVSCVSGNDVIFGSGGNDVIFGSGGNDVIFGGCETDSTVTGPLSASCISGVSGNDVIFGAGGNDVIFGAEGNDIIFGGCDPDSATPTCASGNDVIFGAAGNDIIFAADGNDVVFGAAGNDIIFGGDDDGNDLLYSGTGSDQMTGGAGDTGYLLVPDGIDSVMDSGGVDWLNFAAANAGVSLDLSLNAGQLQTVDANGSILSLNGVFENLRGSSFADFVTGDGGNNILIGAGGADTLLGAGGADVLRGGVSTQVVYLDFDTESGPGDYVYSSLERAQILGRIQLDFSGFDFQFFETRAGAELAASLNGGVFSTLFFNKPPAGGESDELDWRNTNPGASASIDVNTLLGGDGEPDATSANFVAISATVAAHELGHLVSLRHADSFGPIGSGMFEGLSAATYRPPYPGPTSATETPQHLMASPASVHTTLFDAVGNPYFGERELIKLSFAERGTSDTEDATDHGSMAVAQSLGLLPGLPVPNTMPAGANAGQEFAVRAISVLGAVGLGGDGKSSSDFYSFSGTAGQLVNVEIYSESLERARLGNPIDSVMRVYNSSGTLVGYYTGTAVNDDTFEATDSQILDLVLPTDDTYFVEVDTFTFIGNSEFEYSDFCLPDGQPIDPEVTSADACSDTDTGGYELFISTFSIGATLGLDNPGDFLFGSTGNDHLTGSYAQDQLDAGAGNDSMFGLTGNDIYVEVPGSADLINDTAGVDTLDFSGATSNIQIDVSLTLGQVQTVDSAGNTLAITGTIENVIGSSFGDLINGNAAANFLSGGPGNDTLNGGAGDDTFTGGTGVDAINGGPDIDRVVETRNANMTLSNTTLSIGAEGNDSLTSIEQAILTGGSSNNQLNASSFSGTTTLVGLAGNDTLTGGSNADVLEGGEGNDNISGQGGNDKLDGGADNDTLVGEAGSDILLGGAGDDSLTGAADSDFLIGGLGADRLVDSAGDDLEIGGSTAYDSVDEALRMILAEWISGRDYATRVKNIRDGSGSADRLNGPYFLTLVPNAATPIATVFDDFAQDRLTGSSGLDWFFIGTGDIVTDLKNGEQVN